LQAVARFQSLSIQFTLHPHFLINFRQISLIHATFWHGQESERWSHLGVQLRGLVAIGYVGSWANFTGGKLA